MLGRFARSFWNGHETDFRWLLTGRAGYFSHANSRTSTWAFQFVERSAIGVRGSHGANHGDHDNDQHDHDVSAKRPQQHADSKRQRAAPEARLLHDHHLIRFEQCEHTARGSTSCSAPCSGDSGRSQMLVVQFRHFDIPLLISTCEPSRRNGGSGKTDSRDNQEHGDRHADFVPQILMTCSPISSLSFTRSIRNAADARALQEPPRSHSHREHNIFELTRDQH